MEELFRTSDAVIVSWAEAMLAAEGIAAVVLDVNMAVLEGSAGAIPRRVMVPAGRRAEARALIEAAARDLSLALAIRWPDEPAAGGNWFRRRR